MARPRDQIYKHKVQSWGNDMMEQMPINGQIKKMESIRKVYIEI